MSFREVRIETQRLFRRDPRSFDHRRVVGRELFDSQDVRAGQLRLGGREVGIERDRPLE